MRRLARSKGVAQAQPHRRFWTTYVHGDPVSDGAVEAQLNWFFGKSSPEAVAISFSGGFPKAFADHPQCVSWVEAFDYQTSTRYWAQSYERVDSLLGKLDGRLRDLVDFDYHTTATYARQLLVMEAADRELEKDVFFLGPFWLVSAYRERNEYTFPNSQLTAILRAKASRWVALWNRLRPSPDLGAPPETIQVAPLSKRALGLLRRIRPRHFYYLARQILRGLYRLLRRVVVLLWDILSPSTTGESTKITLGLSGLGGSTTATLITIDDSGTGVNLEPGLAIIKEFRKRGEAVVVLTSYASVAERVKTATGVDAIAVPDYDDLALGRSHPITYPLKQELQELTGTIDGAVVRALIENISSRDRPFAVVEAVMEILNAECAVKSVLAIYESLPNSVAAGRWAVRRGLPWIGFFPILVGDRPDGYHFPAPEHLVYGGQLRDHILRAGCEAGSVEVVGSPTYDVFHARDAQRDRELIETQFPASRGKKLVVVATEFFPHPLTEIAPVLEALGGMEGVHVVLKLHPEDSLDFFRSYVERLERNDNIEVVKATDLGALLNTADLLVCVLSNIIISAAVMGTPNLVCDFGGRTGVIDFVKEGLSIGCKDPEELPGLFHDLLFDPARNAAMKETLQRGLARFNGPNDGRSAERVAAHVLAREIAAQRGKAREAAE